MKNVVLLLSAAILVAGCSSKGSSSGSTSDSTSQPSNRSLSIIAPTGAPAIAFYKYAKDANFSTSSEASAILPEMVQGKKDIVVLPTNVGINAIVKNNLSYKIAATITFGNLFVASTGNDSDGVMSKDDYIVLFSPNSVPDLVFHSVYGDELNDGIHYVSSVSDAARCLAAGKNLTANNEAVNYVLMAEPALSNVMAQKDNVQEYANIQSEYFKKYNKEIFQASVFVKNEVNADSFLDSLKKDIDAALTDSSVIEEATSSLGSQKATSLFGVAPNVAAKNIKNGNRLGLGYKKAKDNKEGIDRFLSIFGINETSEDIYY